MMVVGKWKSCTECRKNLSSYHSLWRHKKTIHGNNDRRGGGGINNLETIGKLTENLSNHAIIHHHEIIGQCGRDLDVM